MNDTLRTDERAYEISKIWAGRFAEPREITSFVVFVGGSGGSYASGRTAG